MTQDHSTQPRTTFAQLASTASTPEELGVLFLKAIARSAAASKITSADGKSLVVPFSITLSPATAPEGVTDFSETTDCTQSCWFVLGQPVLCISHCTTNIHPQIAHTHTVTDQTLMSLVVPGPALQNPELVEQSLTASIQQVGTPMEAGYVLVSAMLTSLAGQTDLVAADGSARLTGVATMSFPDPGAAGGAGSGLTSQCTETCVEILGHQVLCFRKCHDVVQ